MTMHEFWEMFPAWEVIVLSIYCLFLAIYFFACMIIGVEDNEIPFFLFSREGYDYLKAPFWISLFVCEIFMLPAQLLLLCVYAIVQITWSIKERPKKEKKIKAKKQ